MRRIMVVITIVAALAFSGTPASATHWQCGDEAPDPPGWCPPQIPVCLHFTFAMAPVVICVPPSGDPHVPSPPVPTLPPDPTNAPTPDPTPALTPEPTPQPTPEATPTPNADPDAADDRSTTRANRATVIDVLSNDSDADGDAIVLVDVVEARRGRAVVDGARIRYTPRRGWTGTDRFGYSIADGRGGTDTAVVTVRVKAR